MPRLISEIRIVNSYSCDSGCQRSGPESVFLLSGSFMHWREVIYRYLSACADDVIRDTTRTRREQFIRNFGTDGLNQREQTHQAEIRGQYQLKGIPGPDNYQVIDADSSQIVAELDECSDFGELVFPTRFVLVRIDDVWLLDDILWRCMCKDGSCFSCKGTGQCQICNVNTDFSDLLDEPEEKCGICNGDQRCDVCRGSGHCEYCQDSDMPGWKSRASL